MIYKAGNFNVRLVRKGDTWGLDDYTHDIDEIMVEFYDSRYVENFTQYGQLVTRYYLSTLLDVQGGLILDGGIPAWQVSAAELQPVLALIRAEVSQ